MNNDKVIFFDGVCNLCNSSVDLLIRVDHKKTLRYSSLQGDFAKQKLGLEAVKIGSVVFLKSDIIYVKSEATVQVLLELGGFYKLIGKILSVFPYRFLNIFYNFVAKNRYRLFGKSESCRVPTKEESTLFIA